MFRPISISSKATACATPKGASLMKFQNGPVTRSIVGTGSPLRFASPRIAKTESTLISTSHRRAFHTSTYLKDAGKNLHTTSFSTPEEEKFVTTSSKRLKERGYLLNYHVNTTTLTDKLAYVIVKTLRIPVDMFFAKRYGSRAIVLETVAAVPGMVGAMMRHMRSLRRMDHDGGWIHELLDEAENERMHLLTFIKHFQPSFLERMFVLSVQGIFFNLYFLLYLISPQLSHRIVGYLEEEAVYSYTEFLKEIDEGRIENVDAPEIAKTYWQLPADAKLREVVEVIRADEACHRDVNHRFADCVKNNEKPNIPESTPLRYEHMSTPPANKPPVRP